MTNPEVEIDGAWHTLSRGEVYVGGAWRTLTRAEYYDGTAWKQVASFVIPMTLSLSPPSQALYGSSHSPVTITSAPITATPTGGLAPFSYLYSITDQLGGTVSLTSTSSASTLASSTVTSGGMVECTVHCVVTDSLGTTASADAPLTFTNDGGF